MLDLHFISHLSDLSLVNSVINLTLLYKSLVRIVVCSEMRESRPEVGRIIAKELVPYDDGEEWQSGQHEVSRTK